MSRIRGIAVALLATIASTLTVYPHQLAYFNEAVGGPENGHKHLLHSNLDWGQDLLLARDYLLRLNIPSENVRVISYFPYPFKTLISSPSENSELAWEVLSSNNAALRQNDPDVIPESKGPAARIGYTLWLFSLNHSS